MTNHWKEASITWNSSLNFIGEDSNERTVQMDKKEGIDSMRLVLPSLAVCTSIDVLTIFQKKKVELENFKINVRGKRASSFPKVCTEIEKGNVLWGENLKSKDVEQAVQLSEEKYYPVSIMPGKTAKTTSSYIIIMPGETEA